MKQKLLVVLQNHICEIREFEIHLFAMYEMAWIEHSDNQVVVINLMIVFITSSEIIFLVQHNTVGA